MSTAPGAPTVPRSALPWVERIGVPRPLMWGYVAVLIFMIGDGVESNYLEPYLRDSGFTSSGAGLVISVYGAFVALGSWLSGALSNVWGPRRVMRIGAVLWIVFEVLFLTAALPSENQVLVYVFYGLRGIAYPLFAYAFLLWIQPPPARSWRGSAAGWFWFATARACRPSVPPSPRSASPWWAPHSDRVWLSLGLVAVGAGDRLLRRLKGGPRRPADGRLRGAATARSVRGGHPPSPGRPAPGRTRRRAPGSVLREGRPGSGGRVRLSAHPCPAPRTRLSRAFESRLCPPSRIAMIQCRVRQRSPCRRRRVVAGHLHGGFAG
ncbi:hypothetical protein STENM223S_03070 [Streptomyces tendae]